MKGSRNIIKILRYRNQQQLLQKLFASIMDSGNVIDISVIQQPRFNEHQHYGIKLVPNDLSKSFRFK